VAVIGLAYHPDSPFAEYADRNGHSAFSAADSARLEELAEVAIEHCDPYAIGHEAFQRLLGAEGRLPAAGLNHGRPESLRDRLCEYALALCGLLCGMPRPGTDGRCLTDDLARSI
jgi:hypothetical protein